VSARRVPRPERKTVTFARAAGDNLVSRWMYEIDQKEPAPTAIQRLYPEWVDRWIFGGPAE